MPDPITSYLRPTTTRRDTAAPTPTVSAPVTTASPAVPTPTGSSNPPTLESRAQATETRRSILRAFRGGQQVVGLEKDGESGRPSSGTSTTGTGLEDKTAMNIGERLRLEQARVSAERSRIKRETIEISLDRGLISWAPEGYGPAKRSLSPTESAALAEKYLDSIRANDTDQKDKASSRAD